MRDWLARDPITRLAAYLTRQGLLDAAASARLDAEAEQLAAGLRDWAGRDAPVNPDDLFDHVYASPTPALEHQRAAITQELGS